MSFRSTLWETCSTFLLATSCQLGTFGTSRSALFGITPPTPHNYAQNACFCMLSTTHTPLPLEQTTALQHFVLISAFSKPQKASMGLESLAEGGPKSGYGMLTMFLTVPSLTSCTAALFLGWLYCGTVQGAHTGGAEIP